MPNTAGTITNVTNSRRYGNRNRYGVAFEPCTPPNGDGLTVRALAGRPGVTSVEVAAAVMAG